MRKRLKEANAFQKITRLAIIFIICTGIYSADGEYIMSRLGYDARSTGMGETGYIYNNCVSVMKINPAGLRSVSLTNIEWSRSELGQKCWYEMFFAGSGFNSGNIEYRYGVNWSRLWMKETHDSVRADFESILYNLVLSEGGHFLDETAFSFSVGNKYFTLGSNLKYEHGGLNPKIINDQYTMYGIGLDIGTTFEISINRFKINEISLCLVSKDIGKTIIKWEGGPILKTPTTLEIGLGFLTDCMNYTGKPLIAEFVCESNSSDWKNINLKSGAEIYLTSVIPFRIGYNGNGITLGIGLDIKKTTINVSYASEKASVSSLSISIGRIL
ncbi:MAG: hypothetical protein AB7T10_05940 [bacterium]